MLIRPSVINFALSRTTIFTPLNRAGLPTALNSRKHSNVTCIGAPPRSLQRQTPRPVRPSSTRPNRLVICVSPRKLLAIFLPYYFIFKPPPTPGTHLPPPASFPSSTRFSTMPFPLLSLFLSSSFLVLRRSFVTLPSFPLPFHRHPLSSSLLPHGHRSFRGAASPQRRDLAHRHFTCVSFARRSRTPLLLLLSSFPTASPSAPSPAPSFLFPLDVLSHLPILFCCCHSLPPFHENCSPPSLLPSHACNTVYPLSPDNDCYRLMRVCILARIHVSTRAAVSRRIQSATRSAGTRGEEGYEGGSRATARCEMHFLRQYLERF